MFQDAPRGKIYWWLRPNQEQEYFTLDGIDYHPVETDSIPPGSASVDITIDDNGHVFPAAMAAGLVAYRVDDSKDTSLSDAGERDVVSTVPGWWLFAKREGGSREQERMRRIMEELQSRSGSS